MENDTQLEPRPALHVAAAVISNADGEILIARRADHLHQGGLWEFPGGKIEGGEKVSQALQRELHEELGIDICAASPLIRIHHDYPDRRVLLDVWRVYRFTGEAHGREGQPIAWVSPGQLDDYEFPAANTAIVTAAQLPAVYLITPEPGSREQWPAYLEQLESRLANGIKLVQFRAKSLDEGDFVVLASQVAERCHQRGAALLINADPEWLDRCGADGVHLNSQRLLTLDERPVKRAQWLAASCHSRDELAKAKALGVDFVVLSPVKETASHPGAMPLGWRGFHELTEESSLPAYALGGMDIWDLSLALHSGGQGIAAISSLWQEDDLENRLSMVSRVLENTPINA